MSNVDLSDLIKDEWEEQESEPKPEPIGAKQKAEKQPQDEPKAKKKAKAKNKPAPKQRKTTVQLLPDTLTNIAEIQFLNRQTEGKKLPMWKIFDEAIADLLKKKRK